jgi:hypothetical protein
MNDQIRDGIHGGFNGSLRSQMSPQLQKRLAEEEAAEARELAQERREQRVRAEQFQESSIQGAIAMALEAGESFHPRWLRGEKLGHTTSEFIAQRSAQMDAEDMQREARVRAAHRKLQAQLEQQYYGDTSAHTIQTERAEEQWRQAQQARSQVIRGRNLRRQRIIEDARKAALGDTMKAIYAVERARPGY